MHQRIAIELFGLLWPYHIPDEVSSLPWEFFLLMNDEHPGCPVAEYCKASPNNGAAVDGTSTHDCLLAACPTQRPSMRSFTKGSKETGTPSMASFKAPLIKESSSDMNIPTVYPNIFHGNLLIFGALAFRLDFAVVLEYWTHIAAAPYHASVYSSNSGAWKIVPKAVRTISRALDPKPLEHIFQDKAGYAKDFSKETNSEMIIDKKQSSLALKFPCHATTNPSPADQMPRTGNVLVKVRRPFKYIKHKGPRPHSASLGGRLNIPRVRTSENRTLPLRRPCANSEEGYFRGDTSSCRHGWKTDNANSTTSRLLRSRNLNLSAINTSACKSKTPKVELVRDNPDLDSFAILEADQTLTPLMKHISDKRLQHQKSYFSDWSTSTSTSRQVSGTYSGLSNRDPEFLTDRDLLDEVLTEAFLTDKRKSATFDCITNRHPLRHYRSPSAHQPCESSPQYSVNENSYLTSPLLI
ncbi:hypothetical protein O181_039334 [Austropuccinia psidii MF-1]|uniref:Uncharacterized protein n=1 Tax=Austropuccinia psidii MF-1 TaxID=1389203 RepID=A0A9Q3DA90_9BASI|nr:hypothetical protein [Austropuccinia psidii MF-1]